MARPKKSRKKPLPGLGEYFLTKAIEFANKGNYILAIEYLIDLEVLSRMPETSPSKE